MRILSHTVACHVGWMRSVLFDQLEIDDAVFVVHDRGRSSASVWLLSSPIASSVSWCPTPAFRNASRLIRFRPGRSSRPGPFADLQKMAREAPVWEPWKLMVMVLPPEPEALASPS